MYLFGDGVAHKMRSPGFAIATVLLFLSSGAASQSTSPPVQLLLGYNAIAGTVDPGGSAGSVRYLGTWNGTFQCLAACLALSSGRCESFTFHTLEFDEGYAGQCFGIVNDPLWSPQQQANINSGRVLWPCRDHTDCSLNGKCMPTGQCLCRRAWGGHKCDELQLLPAERNSGYRYQENGVNVSSWGGAVLRWEKDNTYHMFLAEMRNHCGINSWTLNSQVVHAVSDSPTGSFKRMEVVWNPFAHEPDAIRSPDGHFVMFWSGNHYDLPLCNCTDGSTHPGCQLPDPAMHYTYMSYAPTPQGPWTKPAAILGPKRTMDTNFAAVILENGTLVGFSRGVKMANNSVFPGSKMHLVVASDWRDPSTYTEHHDDLFPLLPPEGLEDPFLYRDADEYFHAIFHNGFPNFIPENCGGHAFSVDGRRWVFTGVAFSNTVHFKDGGMFTFSRRERPHLVFAADSITPVALTSAVQYGGKYGDATYTLLQPIANSS